MRISMFWSSEFLFCFFCVKKSGISVFLVSVENGAGVKNDKYQVCPEEENYISM